MLRYAVRHGHKRADMTAVNSAGYNPLTLACKLGRFDVFDAIMERQSYVRTSLY